MGTSKGYKMPSGGNWEPLKREATDFVKNDGAGSIAPKTLLRDYVKVRSTSSGSGSTGTAGGGSIGSGSGGSGGGTGRGGRARSFDAGVAIAQRLGGFISRVGEVGLAGALKEAGLSYLVGKSAAEVSAALLDKLAGPASTLDQAAAREALVLLNDELLAQTETFEDVEQALGKITDEGGLFGILLQFFGHYIYQSFCTDFYERFVMKVGSSRAASSLKSIRDDIQHAIKGKLAGTDVKRFSWSGRDGRGLSEQVLGDVCDIFEVPA
jgi:hypothetical protein